MLRVADLLELLHAAGYGTHPPTRTSPNPTPPGAHDPPRPRPRDPRRRAPTTPPRPLRRPHRHVPAVLRACAPTRTTASTTPGRSAPRHPGRVRRRAVGVHRGMVRVLKPGGSLWVNLGDKYAQRQRDTGQRPMAATTPGRRAAGRIVGPPARSASPTGIPAKSLIGIPWRYAIRCIDELGLILRAEVIWSKPNGLPESVTDRVRRSPRTVVPLRRSSRATSPPSTRYGRRMPTSSAARAHRPKDQRQARGQPTNCQIPERSRRMP